MATGDEIVGVIDKFGGRALGDAARNVQGLTRSAQALVNKVKGIGLPTAKVNVTGVSGKALGADMRVRIKVPADYLDYVGVGGLVDPSFSLYNVGGIIFPYTPQISYDNKADYAAVTPTHSNYTQYFYKNSSVTDINIIGKFTVQNETDAYILLSTIHLLKALTKMRAGGEDNSGAPPPVCRLYAYGQQMLDETPVVIKSFRIELPDGVDYFTVNKSGSSNKASVPTSCTITLNCAVVYSRNEIKNFTVQNWLATGRTKGYL
jgi:hypothetical protein